MTQMTAEDVQKINDILQKYNIQKFYPAYTSSDEHPCRVVFLPEKLEYETEPTVLIKEGPSDDLKNPKHNIKTGKWEETDPDVLSTQLNSLKEIVTKMSNNTVDGKELDQVRNSVTQIMQMLLDASTPTPTTEKGSDTNA